MAEDRPLQLEHSHGCATIWLNRPERHNALNVELIAQLHRTLDALASQPAVRVVVLGARGESFCAGGDLQWMRSQAQASYEDNLQDARQLGLMLRALARLPKPTIARVQGAALGGGLGLIAACDLAIASREAVFGATETRLGLTPSTIAPYVCQALGERAALGWFLRGERFDAAEAHRLGLIQELTDRQSLDERLQSLVAALLQGAPDAQQHCKWLMAELRQLPRHSDEQLEESARSLASVRAGAEAREGIDAFFARRKPSWAQ